MHTQMSDAEKALEQHTAQAQTVLGIGLIHEQEPVSVQPIQQELSATKGLIQDLEIALGLLIPVAA